jgi:hypothetical protein
MTNLHKNSYSVNCDVCNIVDTEYKWYKCEDIDDLFVDNHAAFYSFNKIHLCSTCEPLCSKCRGSVIDENKYNCFWPVRFIDDSTFVCENCVRKTEPDLIARVEAAKIDDMVS